MSRKQRRAAKVPNGLPKTLNGVQCLAWMCWRTVEAVTFFGGADCEALWHRVRGGEYPTVLGPPGWDPLDAERQLADAVQSGRLPAYFPPSVPSGSVH